MFGVCNSILHLDSSKEHQLQNLWSLFIGKNSRKPFKIVCSVLPKPQKQIFLKKNLFGVKMNSFQIAVNTCIYTCIYVGSRVSFSLNKVQILEVSEYIKP